MLRCLKERKRQANWLELVVVSIRSFQIPRSACLFKGSNGRNHHFWGIMFFFCLLSKLIFSTAKKPLGFKKRPKWSTCHVMTLSWSKWQVSRGKNHDVTIGSLLWRVPSRKLTASVPLKIGRNPKGNNRIPTIHFQGLLLLVSGRVVRFFFGRDFFSPQKGRFFKKKDPDSFWRYKNSSQPVEHILT